MPWFKVDDQFHDHRKAAKAGVEAVGLWSLAGSWCADNLTDGFLPEYVPVRWTPRWRALSKRLIEAGLWNEHERDGEKGWLFHEWEERQPTRDEVEADRAEARDRMALLRAKRKAERRKALDVELAAAEAAGITVKRKRSRKVRPNVQANTPGTFEGSSEPVLGPNPSRPVPSRPDPVSEPPAGRGADAPPPAPTSAQTLIGEWIDHCGDARPDSRVRGHVAKEVGRLLAEGIPYDDVRRGLAAWHDRRLHPSALASVVHELRLGPPPTRPGAAKPSTTDQRVGAALDLARRYASEDATPDPTPALGA